MNNYEQILADHFNNHEELLETIYQHGGVLNNNDSCWKFTKYGGGVTEKEAVKIFGVARYLDGLFKGDLNEAKKLCGAINQALIQKYPEEITEKNAPFNKEFCTIGAAS